jgi:putative PIN family toxin of toxin-antitoxin system
MKMVIDTDVVVAGFRSPTCASAALLQLARRGACRIAVSNALLVEYEAVLTRPEHLNQGDRDEGDAQALLDIIADLAEWVLIDILWRPQARDPDDDLVIDVAVNCGADAIVTFNRRDFGGTPKQFGIECLLPSEALEKVR